MYFVKRYLAESVENHELKKNQVKSTTKYLNEKTEENISIKKVFVKNYVRKSN